jgi:hypothetical protein
VTLATGTIPLIKLFLVEYSQKSNQVLRQGCTAAEGLTRDRVLQGQFRRMQGLPGKAAKGSH